jgi:hypothetical protein
MRRTTRYMTLTRTFFSALSITIPVGLSAVGRNFEEKMAMLLVWANGLNRTVPAFIEAQRLLEAEDSILGRVIRNAKNRKATEIVPGTKFSRR